MLLPIWLRLLMNNFSHIWPVLGRRLCDLRLMTIFSDDLFSFCIIGVCLPGLASHNAGESSFSSPTRLVYCLPKYPHKSALRGTTGRVVAEIEVGVRGAVTLVHILEAPDEEIGTATVAARTKLFYIDKGLE